MTEILGDIIELLTGGLTDMASGIGSGLQSLVQNMFITTSTGGAQSLSIFGGVVVIFAGISLAVGLSKLIYHFIASLGGTGK